MGQHGPILRTRILKFFLRICVLLTGRIWCCHVCVCVLYFSFCLNRSQELIDWWSFLFCIFHFLLSKVWGIFLGQVHIYRLLTTRKTCKLISFTDPPTHVSYLKTTMYENWYSYRKPPKKKRIKNRIEKE